VPADPHLVLGLSGLISGAGDTAILAPPAGQSVRLFYLCLGCLGTNTASLVVTARFGANPAIYTIPLVPGAIWARNIGAGKFYQQGQAVDETLILNNSTGESVCWSAEYLFLP